MRSFLRCLDVDQELADLHASMLVFAFFTVAGFAGVKAVNPAGLVALPLIALGEHLVPLSFLVTRVKLRHERRNRDGGIGLRLCPKVFAAHVPVRQA
jgi:hypothetical protein